MEGLAPEKEKHQFFIDILPVSAVKVCLVSWELIELGLVKENGTFDTLIVRMCQCPLFDFKTSGSFEVQELIAM